MYKINKQFRLVIGWKQKMWCEDVKIKHRNDRSKTNITDFIFEVYLTLLKISMIIYSVWIQSMDETYHIGSVK